MRRQRRSAARAAPRPAAAAGGLVVRIDPGVDERHADHDRDRLGRTGDHRVGRARRRRRRRRWRRGQEARDDAVGLRVGEAGDARRFGFGAEEVAPRTERAVLQTSARLLRLLSLLQARSFWAGTDLTSRLEVTARTLRRDVDRLRTLGYPVDSTSGPAGGYALAAGARLPPLMLDDDEGIAVALALTQASGTMLSSGDAALRALAKLEKVLPTRLRKRLGALRGSILRVGERGPKVELDVVAKLASACSERHRVHFAYRDQSGQATARIVEPQQVALVERRWYLVAWDTAREDWRTFRLDRIDGAVTTGETFLARAGPDEDMTSYLTRTLSVAPYPHRARVVFHAPAETIRARVSPAYGSVEAIDDARCRLETGARSLDGIAMWIAYLDVPFEVESPPELVARLRALSERLARATELSARTARGSDARAPSPPRRSAKKAAPDGEARGRASKTSSRRSPSR